MSLINTSHQVSAPKNITFQSLCDLLEQFEKMHKEKQKKSNMSNILERFAKSLDVPNQYPYLRLLAPQLDHAVYGLKATTLGKIYVEKLGLKGTTAESILSNAKNSKTSKPGSNNEWWSNKVSEYLQQRGWKIHLTQKMTMIEICTFLDDIAAAPGKPQNGQESKKELYAKILPKLNAVEHKWLIRVILKDLHCGLSSTTLLTFINPAAEEMYKLCSNLKEICNFFDPTFKPNKSLTLFAPLQPMLAEIMTKSTEDQLKEMRLVVETKFDGERCLIHKQGDTIKYYSRKSNDTSNLYSTTFDPILTKYVSATNCILDGEMLVWDTELETFRIYHGARKLGGIHQDEDQTGHLCFVVFDVVYLNDRDLRDLTLEVRRQKLGQIVTTVPNKLVIPKFVHVNSIEEIRDELTKAGEQNHEGIMIKDLESKYIVGERNKSWMKLKCQFLSDTFDLIIIGAAKGSKDKITRFLLGLKHKIGENEVIWPFVYCGSGLSNNEKEELVVKLKTKWKEYKGPLSQWGNWTPAVGLRPNYYIDPADSIMLEIKALDIITSESYKFDFTLRSPTTLKIRGDKLWNECKDLEFITNLKDSTRNTAPIEMKKKKQGGGSGPKKALNIMNTQKNVHVELLVSNIFSKMEFHVIHFEEAIEKMTLQEFNQKILENGGTIVSNTMPNKDKVIEIASINLDNYTIFRNYMDPKKQMGSFGFEYDILLPSYVIACVREKLILDISPEFLLHRCKKTFKALTNKYDKYDDSFTSPATLSSLLRSMNMVSVEKCHQSDFEVFMSRNFPRLFDGLVFYVDRFHPDGTKVLYSVLEIIELKLLEHGAMLVGNKDKDLFKHVNHVVVEGNIVNKDLVSTICSLSSKCYIVQHEWVEKCIEKLNPNKPKVVDRTPWQIDAQGSALEPKRYSSTVSEQQSKKKRVEEVIEIE